MKARTNFFRNALTTAVLILAVSATGAAAATFTVTNTNNTGAGSLRQAVTDSNSAAGSDTIAFDASFNSPQTIILASVITVNPATGDTLTITGPGANLLTVSGNNAVQIFHISSNDTASVSGMTLTQAVTGAIVSEGNLTVANMTFNANTNNGGFNEGGGAISGRSALSLTVSGCIFTNNTNTAGGSNGVGGGAISNEVPATITNSIFTNNSAVGGAPGGAIATYDGLMTISGSTFVGNTTTSTTGGNSLGGAIAVRSGGQLTINNSVLTGNSTTRDGGAVYYQPNATTGPFLTINDSTISNNAANSDGDTTGSGGGLFLTGTGSVTITNSTINGNTSKTGNTSTGNGGGIDVSVPTTITNSTISGNTAERSGGGIYTTGTSTIIVNINSSTVVNNTATSNGGGISATSSNPVNFRNSIFANNTASGGTSPDVLGTINSNGFNLIENTTGAVIGGNTATNITGVDPRVDGVLRNNGGAVKTHGLRLTSPALNAGDAANSPATDARGFPRPGNGAALPDIGAYERQSNDVVVAAAFDFENDGLADLSVFRSSPDPDGNFWFVRQSSDNLPRSVEWGLQTDKLTPADYDGDEKTDVAIWRDEPATPDRASFFILQSATNTVRFEQFGRTGDAPSTSGDWDGDGKADPSVYRDSAAGAQNYIFYKPSTQPNIKFASIPWGATNDKAVRGDFDGDKKTDAAIFRPSTGTWIVSQSSNAAIVYQQFGASNDKLVPADYDGDGRTDFAVYRSGTWIILLSATNQVRYAQFGLSGDALVPADYDNDGKADIAVWRDGLYYIAQSSNAQIAYRRFGLSGDIPVASAYIP